MTGIFFSNCRKEVQQVMEQVYQETVHLHIKVIGEEEEDFPDIPDSPILDVDELHPSMTLNMSHEAGWTSVYPYHHSTPNKEEEENSHSTSSTILYSDSELSLYDVTPEPQAQPELLDV